MEAPPLSRSELSPSEQQRARLLVVTRRRATGLLVLVTLAFAVSTALEHGHHWLAWVQATAVASMVGGLADWFAVTALFRRPLGLPIPHTAIVVERKDRFGETLGSFVQESFLSPEAVNTRLRAARALPRAAAWLADEEHARSVAARATEMLSEATSRLSATEAMEVIESLVRRRVDETRLAPLAGRILDQVTRDGRHEPVIDSALQALSAYVAEHGSSMHRRLGIQSPWWLPGTVSNRMVARLLLRTQTLLADMAADRDHPLRRQLADGLVDLAGRLQNDPQLLKRGEELKSEFLSEPTIRQLAAAVWADARKELASQAADADSELRRRLAELVARTGRRLIDDPALAESMEKAIEGLVASVLTSFDQELVALVTGTIQRWDANDTSRRLELLLGPDLQYIRINGTVVGAAAGLALHAVAAAAG